jgi:hypothetical protein
MSQRGVDEIRLVRLNTGMSRERKRRNFIEALESCGFRISGSSSRAPDFAGDGEYRVKREDDGG